MKLYLIFINLVFVVTIKSQTCQISLNCGNNGSYTSPDLVLTKNLFEKKIEEDKLLSVEVIGIDRVLGSLRRVTTANKKSIASNKKVIDRLRKVDKLNLKTIKSQLKKQRVINAHINKKIQDLYS